MSVQVIPWQMKDADGNLLSPNTYTNTIYDPDGNNVTGLATEREIGNAYDSSKTYPTYSPYCIHNNKFYKYSGASGTTTTGDWDSTKWTETPIANELSLLNSNLIKLVVLSTSIVCDYADSNTIGYRNTNANKVDVSTIIGYPTGSNILAIVPYSAGGAYGAIASIDASGYLHANLKVSGTAIIRVLVLYI